MQSCLWERHVGRSGKGGRTDIAPLILNGGEWPASHPRPLCHRRKLSHLPIVQDSNILLQSRVCLILYEHSLALKHFRLLLRCRRSFRSSEMLHGVRSFLVIVISVQRSDLQAQNSPRRSPGTGECTSNIKTYYFLRVG
jgi:hypothetical protein